MANNKEEAGKGTPRPGEMPGGRRTYATLDLTAAEVEGRTAAAPAPLSASAGTLAGTHAAAHVASPPEARSQAKSQSKSQSKSESKSQVQSPAQLAQSAA